MSKLRKDKNKSMRSIKTIILKDTIAILTIAVLLVGGSALIANYIGTMNLLEKNMTVTAKVAASNVSSKLEGYLNMVSELANDRTFDTSYINADDIIAKNRLSSFVTRNGFVSAKYSDVNGICSDGTDVSMEQFYHYCKESLLPKVADLLVSTDTGELSTIFAAPIVKENEFKGMIIVEGDATILSDIVKQINIGKTGSSYIINKKGDIIAHNNIQMVLEQHNAIELSKKYSYYKKLLLYKRK